MDRYAERRRYYPLEHCVRAGPLVGEPGPDLDRGLPGHRELDGGRTGGGGARTQCHAVAAARRAGPLPLSLVAQCGQHRSQRGPYPLVAVDVDVAGTKGVALAKVERIDAERAGDEVDV